MTPDDRDARLTAFALDDPSLSAADRREIEAQLEADPAARRAVDETRAVAELLANSLAAEQAALPAESPVAVPSPRRAGGWVVAVAAGVAFVFVFGVVYVPSVQRVSDRPVASGPGARRYISTLGGDAPGAEPAKPNLTYPDGAGLDAEVPAAIPNDSIPEPIAPPKSPVAPATPGFGGGGRTDPRVLGGNNFGGGGNFNGGFGGGGFGGGNFAGGTLPTPTPALPQPAVVAPPAIARGPAVSPVTPAYGYVPAAPPDGYAPIAPPALPPPLPTPDPQASHDRFPAMSENRFVTVEGPNALSTFGVDVDTASYSIVRKYLTAGQLPPADAVRLEELVNYFPYRDKAPDGDDPFAVTAEVAACPWQPKHRLARVALKAKPIDSGKRPPSNLVFLIDVSGSMNEPNKLPLVKASLRLLVQQLGENDRVAVVVYAGSAGLVLDSTSAAHQERIVAALDKLEAGGSTNGEGGIRQAYAVAAANFVKGGTNRVVLCTDGDWNVGTTGTADLVKLIEEKRQTGVFLSVLGFGMGNLRDEMMVNLAGKGNGNYAYIDTLREANKALVEQLGGTLVTVAKDVKIQVEFNPATVAAYRLLGYEKRALAAKDFKDDTKDAGEMGAGHVVTALYELVPAAGAGGGGEKLRYQPNPPAPADAKAGESFVVRTRHKKPDGDVSTPREFPVTDGGAGYAAASEDFRFAAAVAEFAMLLRGSADRGASSFASALELADAAKSHDPGGYRAEFVEMVKRAKAVAGRP